MTWSERCASLLNLRNKNAANSYTPVVNVLLSTEASRASKRYRLGQVLQEKANKRKAVHIGRRWSLVDALTLIRGKEQCILLLIRPPRVICGEH